MNKEELEEKLGFELTEDGFEELHMMYRGCNLGKDAFARVIKSGGQFYKVEENKKEENK